MSEAQNISPVNVTVDPTVEEVSWDNVEEFEDNSNEGEMEDDWDSIGENEGSVEESSEEDSNEDSGENREEPTEEASKDDSKTEESSDEDTSGEDKSGEEDSKAVNLNDDTEIEVKIDGESQKISLQELKNNYSGKVAFDKKFSELDKERQDYKKEVEDINSYINDLGKTMKESSLLDGFYKVGELVGLSPHALKQSLIKELVPEISRIQDLSQDQVDLEYQRQETEYMKNKYETDQAKIQKEQADKELNNSVMAVREDSNINDSEWNDAIKYLDEHLPPADAITPELVGQYVNFDRAGTRADELLNKFDVTLKDNKDVFNSLQDSIYENPSLNNEDFMELLQEAYGNAKVELAENNVKEVSNKKAPKKTVAKKQEISPIMDGDSEALDWDDIL